MSHPSMDPKEQDAIDAEALRRVRANEDRGVEPLRQFFDYQHLPPHLQAVSRPFGELADKVLELPRNPERTTALRKLLEAKDCAVRALLFKIGAVLALLFVALPSSAQASPPRCTIWEYLGGECAQPASQLQARAADAGPLSLPWAVQAFGGASIDLGGTTRGAIRPLTGVGAGLKVLDFGGRGLDVLAVGGTTGTEGGLLGGGACFQVTPGTYSYVAEACAAVLFPVLAGQPEPPRAALLFAVGPKF